MINVLLLLAAAAVPPGVCDGHPSPTISWTHQLVSATGATIPGVDGFIVQVWTGGVTREAYVRCVHDYRCDPNDTPNGTCRTVCLFPGVSWSFPIQRVVAGWPGDDVFVDVLAFRMVGGVEKRSAAGNVTLEWKEECVTTLEPQMGRFERLAVLNSAWAKCPCVRE